MLPFLVAVLVVLIAVPMIRFYYQEWAGARLADRILAERKTSKGQPPAAPPLPAHAVQNPSPYWEAYYGSPEKPAQ